MRVLVLIPARGGSKGIPRKNIKLLAGKPLIQYAIEVGREITGATYVTTDDNEIATLAAHLGAGTIMRPKSLAEDDTPMYPVITHALGEYEPTFGRVDVVLLLQPTAPLRTAEHVLRAMTTLRCGAATSAVSVVPIPGHYAPQWALLLKGGCLEPFDDFCPEMDSLVSHRQAIEPAFTRDGTVYAIDRRTIEQGQLYGERCVAVVIPPNESVNIDTEDDWRRAEEMVRSCPTKA